MHKSQSVLSHHIHFFSNQNDDGGNPQLKASEIWLKLLLYTMWGCRHLFMHVSLKSPLQHINQVEVWTLTESLLHLDCFFLFPFSAILL